MSDIYTLSAQAIALADDIGQSRHRQAKTERGIGDTYVFDADENMLAQDIWAARAELALVLYLGGPANVKWNAFLDGRKVKLGNVEEIVDRVTGQVKFDVKMIRQSWHTLQVKLHKVKHDVNYVLINTEHHPRYELFGWATGAQVAAAPRVEPRPGKPCRRLKRFELNQDCKQLFHLLPSR